MTEKRKEIEEYILRRLGKDAANVQVRVDKNDVTIFTDESLIGRIIGPIVLLDTCHLLQRRLKRYRQFPLRYNCLYYPEL